MKRRVRFDPAASSGTPSAIKTIPKNGGGNGRNTNPISRQKAPVSIKAIDFKCFSLRKGLLSTPFHGIHVWIIWWNEPPAKRMFKDI
ncbi:hypothetical protein [Thalassospira sp.]|uniref:hypothetical protein n=1 Tax=Thalassospira sp. TaxID=1912094 RepID=UPI0025FEBAEC|nr:hypothetical protein [Thalassospira sp.]|tara:strand:- start:8082 stop:8342 length:261 start_codon:yes stop_codon:yes gene_type:complete